MSTIAAKRRDRSRSWRVTVRAGGDLRLARIGEERRDALLKQGEAIAWLLSRVRPLAILHLRPAINADGDGEAVRADQLDVFRVQQRAVRRDGKPHVKAAAFGLRLRIVDAGVHQCAIEKRLTAEKADGDWRGPIGAGQERINRGPRGSNVIGRSCTPLKLPRAA